MNSQLHYPDHIASMKPYVPGMPISTLAQKLNVPEHSIVKLASNENPQGPSPRALAALSAANIDLSRYPDNDMPELTSALAAFHDVPADWVVVGAGSESVIGNAVATLLGAGSIAVCSEFSFQAYVNAIQRVGAKSVVVPSPAFTVDLDGLTAALKQNPSVVYIANPGNPTGTCVAPNDLLGFLQAVPSNVAVLLDEAYFEFMPADLRPDSINWVRRFPNLLVSRTFSKAYGLAGLRVGYGIAQPTLADMLRRVRPPFTVSQAAQAAAVAALDDQEFLGRTVQLNNRSKALLCDGLRQQGIPFLESHTNFVLARVGDGGGCARALEQQGVIVRPVGSYGLPVWVRISVGTEGEVKRLLSAMLNTTGPA